MTEPDEQVCRQIDVDGEPVVVRGGTGDFTEQDHEALAALTRAARERFALDPAKALVQDLSSAVRLAAACIPDGDIDTALYGTRNGTEARRDLKQAASRFREFVRQLPRPDDDLVRSVGQAILAEAKKWPVPDPARAPLVHVAPMGADAMDLGRAAVSMVLAAGWRQVPESMPPELALIAEERQRVIASGRTAEHDDEHTGGELARAAAVYALFASGCAAPALWPWPKLPTLGNTIDELVKAGQLIAAEIARLQRASSHRERQERPPGPEDGHQFHFSVQVQGSYRVGAGPHVDAAEPTPPEDAFRLTVRAWNLRDACREAALIPLVLWKHGSPSGDEEGHGR